MKVLYIRRLVRIIHMNQNIKQIHVTSNCTVHKRMKSIDIDILDLN